MPTVNSQRRLRRATLGSALIIILGSGGSFLTWAAESSAPALPEYHPSMGDLMTMAVQPRHIKLGLAGQLSNWSYAAYELSELRNAFGRIARTIPQYRNAETASLLSAMTQAPLDALEAAIKAKDRAQFNRSYATLTAVCNGCHVSQDHAMVVIKVPRNSAFVDQSFEPSDSK